MRGNDAEAATVKEDIPHDHLFMVTGLSSNNLEKLAEGMWISSYFEGMYIFVYTYLNQKQFTVIYNVINEQIFLSFACSPVTEL